mgnify:CR=1 FL=1
MTSATRNDRNNRMILGLIAGLPLTMILAASWLWYFVIEGDLDLIGAIGTANHGTLIQPPRQIQPYTFEDDVGAAFQWRDLEPRWTMVVANRGATCDGACEARLYVTRQIHIALGKEFNKVRRVYIGDTPIGEARIVPLMPRPTGWPTDVAPGALGTYLAEGHVGLVALATEPDNFSTLFPTLADSPEQWYLVDPAGWVMMRYPDALDYKKVIADLKFLLKNSGELQ